MSKAGHTRALPRAQAGRAGVGLALAATTAVSVAVPAAQAQAAPSLPTAALHGGATGARTSVPSAVPQMTYRVQPGDTVSHIALRTGSSVSAIVRANNLDSRALIRVGQMLKIPSAAGTTATAASTPAPAAAPASAGATTHTVGGGDTVSVLAKRYGTTVSAIVAANGLKSANLIYVGQRLTIPGAAGPAAAAPSAPAPAPTKSPAPAKSSAPAQASGATHRVVAGDTVSVLAKRYGTTVSAIVAANRLPSANLIHVGQVLTIPGSSVSTPAPAAPKPAAPAPAPKPAAPTPAPKPAAPAPAPAATSGTYTVRSGDTVSALAKTWGTTVSAVVQANGLSSAALIYVGQTLKIPGTASTPNVTPVTKQLVPSSFLGRTYPEATVNAANANKAALLAVGVPSRAEMQAMVVRVARDMGVDPALAQAHAYQESGFNHASVSPANAIGTMQVIPSSGEWASQLVGRHLNLMDPYDNVVAGVAIIRALHKTFPTNLDYAIGAYYQGAGGVQRYGLYSDTKMYVNAVKAHKARF